MNWLPVPTDFRAAFQAALNVSDPSERLNRLISLAQYNLSLLETIQLDRATADASLKTVAGYPHVRLAILASATVNHLVPGIRVAGMRRSLLIDVYVGLYGQYRQELLNAASTLHEFAPEMVLFSLTAQDVIRSVPITSSPAEVEDALTRYVDELRVLWAKSRQAFGAEVIQQTFLDTSDPLLGSYDRRLSSSPVQVVGRLNERVAEAASSDHVLLLDIARASQRAGRDKWFDPVRWFQAKQEIAPHAVPVYGEWLARVIAAQRGLSRKCLVLDLDNTLWHGVVGDDGINGIMLGQGTAVGEAHLALQHYAKQLAACGVILAVCSKNDPIIAEEVFEHHPEMILKRSDFAAFVANWKDKAENLPAVAAQLNIGIDSLVFIDDNPAERARIRHALPMVGVPELPGDPAGYVPCLAEAGYFEAVSFTSEDQQRSAQYAANAARDQARSASENLDDFLRSLEMSVRFGPFVQLDIARITQLINKTNQFNPTNRRYTQEEVAGFAAAPGYLTLQFRLQDRFGDNGLVSAMILVPDPDQPGTLVMDTWVMSCRVFGRQLEIEAMNIAVELAKHRGISAIRAEYVPTNRNGTVGRLFPGLGFDALHNAPSRANGTTKWIMSLTNYVPKETPIRRIEDESRRYSQPIHENSA